MSVYYFGNLPDRSAESLISYGTSAGVRHRRGQRRQGGTLIGRAYVLWRESRTSGSGDDQTTETVTYQDEEPYFNFRVNLWGGDGREHFLQPGNYQFPFSFKLPEVPLPTSHELGCVWCTTNFS